MGQISGHRAAVDFKLDLLPAKIEKTGSLRLCSGMGNSQIADGAGKLLE